MLIEDDEDVATAVCDLLRDAGYTTTWVQSVAAARAAFAASRPATAIIDLVLHGERTEELVAEWASLPDPPGMILSSVSPDAKEIAERHRIPFVARPFDIDAFEAAVARVSKLRLSTNSR